MSSDDDGTLGPMQVGTRATVRVAIVMEYIIEVEMPPDGDPGEHADFELFARDRYDDYDEKDVINARILDEDPLYEDDFEGPEEWPSYV